MAAPKLAKCRFRRSLASALIPAAALCSGPVVAGPLQTFGASEEVGSSSWSSTSRDVVASLLRGASRAPLDSASPIRKVARSFVPPQHEADKSHVVEAAQEPHLLKNPTLSEEDDDRPPPPLRLQQESTTTSSRAYRYRSYSEILSFFSELNAKYPQYVEVYDALHRYPDIADGSSWAKCGPSTCKIPIVRISDEKTLKPTTPELFLSGELHGNERIGPQVVVELAEELVTAPEKLAKHPDDAKLQGLVYLLQNRSLYMIAMSNPHGYYHNRREERGMDPNRDFPYLQPKCMRTVTARVINELFREHLFRAMITFHGGTRVLSYEWGSKNHLKGRKSTEPPDNSAQVAIATAMQAAAGKQRGKAFYPIGTMTDTVYWVDGGLEDWSYAASWEGPKVINTCKTSTYKDYPASRTTYHDGSADIRTMVYLVETDNRKTPPANTLGSTSELYGSPDLASSSHVPRNMRMSLKLIELIEPAIRLSPTGSFHGIGCDRIDSVKLVVLKGCSASGSRMIDSDVVRTIHQWPNSPNSQIPCRGLQLWKSSTSRDVGGGAGEVSLVSDGSVREKLVAEIGKAKASASSPSCVGFVATFDSGWGVQSNPDPNKPPQTHLARARLEPEYRTSAKSSAGAEVKIDTGRQKVYAFSWAELASAVENKGEGTGSQSATSTSAPPTPSPQPPNAAPQTTTKDAKKEPVLKLPVTPVKSSSASANMNMINNKASTNTKSNSVPLLTPNESGVRQVQFALGFLVAILLACNVYTALKTGRCGGRGTRAGRDLLSESSLGARFGLTGLWGQHGGGEGEDPAAGV